MDSGPVDGGPRRRLSQCLALVVKENTAIQADQEKDDA